MPQTMSLFPRSLNEHRLVVQQYVLKTIENIAHKESRWSQRFATPGVMGKLVSVLKLCKADNCRYHFLF